MAGLRDQFEHFYAQGEDAVKTAVEGGLVTPDTNVLLNLYRFQGQAREDLFSTLESLKARLWIPHQVGLEFHRRRLDVIYEQEQYFTSTPRELKKLIDGLRQVAEAFPTRIGLDGERTKEILVRIADLSSLLDEEVTRAKRANEVRLKDCDSDKVRTRLETLFDGRVGVQMKPAELQAAREEARRRVDAKIPPGYEDGGKADPSGDYLVFRQLMNEAADRKMPVVLVTDDEKPDWYRKQQGKPMGARPELREEMMAEAGVPLLAMTTESFLRNVEKYLDLSVDPETLDQARRLPGIVEEDHRTALESQTSRWGTFWASAGRILESYAAVRALSGEPRVEFNPAAYAALTPLFQESEAQKRMQQTMAAYLQAQSQRNQVLAAAQLSEERSSDEQDE